MARNLIWKDLTVEQLDSIRHPHPKKGLTGRDLLAKFLGIADQHDPKNATHMDLYVHTLQFGQEQQLADDKLSGLFSIVKDTHLKSIGQQLTVEASFRHFQDLLLSHSVQRPPYSIGLLTYQEMKKVMDWMLDTYYRHYKLYQYTYTNRVTMSVTTIHPLDTIELAPELQPLMDAMTEQEHQAILTEEERKKEQEDAAAAAAAAEVAEQARLALLRQEYEAAIPEEVKDAVAVAVEKELALMKKAMEEQFAAQQAELLAKIAAMQAGPTAGRPASGAVKK